MSKNSFDAFADMLESLVKELDSKMPDKVSMAIMVEAMDLHKKRIFERGEKTEGQKIGTYNDDPNYYSKDTFIRESAFKAQGKNEVGLDAFGKKKKRATVAAFDIKTRKKVSVAVRNGNKERTSMFLPGGYKEFRDIQGRQTAFVDWKFSGSAERSLNVVKIGQPVYYGVTDAKESKKFDGLTDKFGEVLPLSNEEKLYITDELTQAAKQIMQDHGKP